MNEWNMFIWKCVFLRRVNAQQNKQSWDERLNKQMKKVKHYCMNKHCVIETALCLAAELQH